ncbi:response regulator [Spirochaetia bacterium]|nr:response regulator [Spirochaetia bacterium]
MENKKRIIVLVDDNPSNLTTGKDLLKDHYDVFTVPSGEKLFSLLGKIQPDLILLDIEMPAMSGYEVIKKMNADPYTKVPPVIFLTSLNDPGSELEGLSLGAVDYISKPFSPPLLIKRIENHLLITSQKNQLIDFNENLQQKVQEKTGQVVELQNSLLTTMAELVEFRDDTTGGHIERTQAYLTLLLNFLWKNRTCYWNIVSEWNLAFLTPSAQLHDVGKIHISDAILNKPGKLTPEEFEIMKNHAVYGEKAIESIMKRTKENDFLLHAKIFAGTHHEKWDGSGYPRGLKGVDIPLQGRLMAIADVYDALIAQRPYKKPMEKAEAEDIIIKGAETHFDPLLAEVFKDLAPDFAGIADQYSQGLQGNTAP